MTIETSALSMYDLSRWRPITHAQYVDELGACFLTNDEPNSLTMKAEYIAHDGSLRLVTFARIVDRDTNEVPADMDQPYLMVLFYPEGSAERKNLCFKRTDVELWLP